MLYSKGWTSLDGLPPQTDFLVTEKHSSRKNTTWSSHICLVLLRHKNPCVWNRKPLSCTLSKLSPFHFLYSFIDCILHSGRYDLFLSLDCSTQTFANSFLMMTEHIPSSLRELVVLFSFLLCMLPCTGTWRMATFQKGIPCRPTWSGRVYMR